VTRHRLAFVVAGLVLLAGVFGAALAQRPPVGPTSPPSVLLIAKLPLEWREPVTTLLTLTDAQQNQLLAVSDEVLRQTFARQLARLPKADAFLKTQLSADPSASVRTTIAQIFASDSRWLAMPDTMPLVERVAASDPDAGASMAALETLRRLRMRGLNALLAERVAAARLSGDVKGLTRLIDEQERWISLERGVMLPAFMRTAATPFTVAPADRSIRVLAFGDFGNGSVEQRNLAQTIAAYHRERPLSFAITLGDNFYTRGMESPSDPRWQTWWEELYGPLGITFYASLGNHDWGQPDSPAAEILYSHQSKTWHMPASYYTFTAGPVQFFALDTQSVALADKQLQWLDGEISRSQARWKVVYGHHPIYSGGNYEERPDLVEKLLPLLRKRVDAYICGHDHNLQVLTPEDGVRFYVAGGGGAGLYELRPYDRSVFASRSNGFAVIEADAARLTVAMIDGTGKQVYEDVLTKPASTSAGQ
jgi:tartrate-resistant acid phosphatase type 5